MARDDAPESESSEADHGGRADRLQKVLAAAGVGSRRDCETLITEGRVTVDGKVVTELGTKVDPSACDIAVDGEALRKPRRIYYAVNKPVGVVTTNLDPSGRTRVIDLVPTEERVFAVGRLDRASEGLIIVTNDGALADRVTHPRYGLEKTYQVRIAGSISDEDVQKLRHGIHLSDGFARVVSLRIRGSHKQSTDLEIVLNEGKNREIRRILARVGHKVLTLRRTAVGPLKLADLEPGECRKLSNGEVKELLDATQERKKKVRPERPEKKPFAPTERPPGRPEGRPPRDDEQRMPRPRPERPERTGRPPAGKPVGGKRPKSPYADSQAAMGGRPPKAPPQNKPPAPPAGDEPLKLEDFLPPSIEPTAGQSRGGVIRYDENEPDAGEQQGARTYGGGRGGKPGGRKFGNKPGGARSGGRPTGGRTGGFSKGPPRGKRPAFGAPPEGLEGGDVPLRGARKPPGGFRNKRMGSGRPPMGGGGGPGGDGPPPRGARGGARGGARPGGFGGRRSGGPGGPGAGGSGGATGGGPRGRKPGGGPRGGRPGGPGGGRPGGRPGGGRPGGRPGGGRPGGGGPRGRRP